MSHFSAALRVRVVCNVSDRNRINGLLEKQEAQALHIVTGAFIGRASDDVGPVEQKSSNVVAIGVKIICIMTSVKGLFRCLEVNLAQPISFAVAIKNGVLDQFARS